MNHGRPKHAMHGRGRPESYGRIEIVLAEPARPACRIWDPGFHADPVAGLQFRHRGADFDDLAGGLVAENHRLFDKERPDGAMRVVMHIAAAHADRPQRDPNVAWSERFLERIVAQGELIL